MFLKTLYHFTVLSEHSVEFPTVFSLSVYAQSSPGEVCAARVIS